MELEMEGKEKGDMRVGDGRVYHHQDKKTFEFVTVIGQSSQRDRDEHSRKVRVQAMRDFVIRRKMGMEEGEEGSRWVLREPQELRGLEVYKGRFRLESWGIGRGKKGGGRGRRRGGRTGKGGGEEEVVDEEINEFLKGDKEGGSQGSPRSLLDASRLDPFDSLAVVLDARSERLLDHYQTMYTTNSIAINSDGTFFSTAAADAAMLHSILYLIALHYDIKRGMAESHESLHHGGEALSIINKRLRDSETDIRDSTISSVALLVNKENLAGKYDVAVVHMQGLQKMVSLRGGVENLKGIHQRIVAWSDLCHSNVWEKQPAFSYLNPPLPKTSYLIPDLSEEPLPEETNELRKVVDDLRVLSSHMDSTNPAKISRTFTSALIYSTEYKLLDFNSSPPSHPAQTSTLISISLPLRTALHLYLYLTIRDIPPTQQLIQRLLQRLRDSLEPQIPGFWTANRERRIWLLWILFVASMAATTAEDRFWWTRGVQTVCGILGVKEKGEFEERLRKCMWVERGCGLALEVVWGRVELGSKGGV
ncbi:hypothetical protein ACMFMG_011889 [Clarireedia jacksonii]